MISGLVYDDPNIWGFGLDLLIWIYFYMCHAKVEDFDFPQTTNLLEKVCILRIMF